jgi:Uncharacterized conserved protein
MNKIHRRDFIRTSLFGGALAAAMPSYAMEMLEKSTKIIVDTNSRVSLVTGGDRADMAFRALQPFSKEIAQAVGNKRIIVKPNLVSSSIQLSATHKDTIEGILEFYKSIKKLNNVVVAESTADGPAMVAYDNYGFIPVAEKYKVKLIDVDDHPSQLLYVMDELDLRPKPVRMSSLLTDRNNFVMSVARFKTHDRVVATLTLKNVVLGAPVKDPGFAFGRNRTAGTKSDKAIVHGNGFRGIHFNLFNSAFTIRPDLGFVDGYDGMEGDGPTNGTVVDHRVCIAGLDWLAVDRVGLELMGVDSAKVGYLTYCGEAGLGQYDINKIEIVGEKIADHIKPYKMSRNYEKHLQWMNPIKERGEALY